MNTLGIPSPLARLEQMALTPDGDNLLIFDAGTATLHRLNQAMAAVWQMCNGNTSVTGIAAAADLTVEKVRLALHELLGANLLQQADSSD